jgi:hypothetical protein
MLIGNTANIKADTMIKVRGTRRKRVPGLTDQPTFVVEKLGKTYGPCPSNSLTEKSAAGVMQMMFRLH